jgi:opacity protein-like surface antigen
MKKLNLFLTLTFLILATVNAQNKNWNLGISIGSSFPLGNFASKDINNSKAGWAITGANFGLKFNYKLDKGYFGLSALLNSQFNPIDVDQMAKESENLYPDYSWKIDATSWKTNCILFGAFATLPISEKVNFEPHGMIGLMISNSPEITSTAKIGGNTSWGKQNETSASSFAYLVGVGFKYKLTNKLNLLGNLDYLGSKPEFLNVEITGSSGGRQTNTLTQNISNLNLSLGIGISL